MCCLVVGGKSGGSGVVCVEWCLAVVFVAVSFSGGSSWVVV